MEIKLTNQESEKYFYNALCNAVGSGYISSYGINISVETNLYDRAKKIASE